jgi:hypothetical protein
VACGLALLACGHEEPFRPGSYGPDGPFNPATLTRLTLNLAPDRAPAWTPDGAGLWYTVARTDRADGDHCLGLLPPAGGARLETRCQTGLDAEDSTDVFEAAAPAADGRLAYVHITGAIGSRVAVGAELVVAPAGGGPGTRVLRLPNAPPGQRRFDRASHVQWLGDTLVFVGAFWMYVEDRLAGTSDTIQSGVAIEVLAPGDTVPAPVAGTEWASSVAAEEGGHALYFTVNGDTRVFRRDVVTGATDTVHDFGALGIARDVRVRAGRLVAIVGGNVAAGSDPNLNAVVQVDEGGFLYVVDLGTGARAQLPDTAFRYRRPSLSPDGRLIVAEVMTPQGEDLWRIALP